MSLFGSLLQSVLSGFEGGNSTEAQLAQLVLKRFQTNQGGGLGGLVSELTQGGLGHVVQSWVGTGPNQSISPQQIGQALNPEWIKQLATHAGIPPEAVNQYLAQILPKLVDRLTPDGRLPAHEPAAASPPGDGAASGEPDLRGAQLPGP